MIATRAVDTGCDLTKQIIVHETGWDFMLIAQSTPNSPTHSVP